MIDQIASEVKARRLILFVGSGVSRSLGLPSWSELIAEMGRQLGFEPDVFLQYAGFLELAEYYQSKAGSLGKLRSWMDREWHKDESIVDRSRIHNAILELNFPLIYTTNYDRWLEIAHTRKKKEFTRIANVRDIASARPGIVDIVKLHGDFEHDESLVLTESSYFERLVFDSPLDIRLRADSIGMGILFVGYSLSDVNVRYLLYKLEKLWSTSSHAKARPRSYMLLARPNLVQEEVLRLRGIDAVVPEVDDPEASTIWFMEELVKKVSSKP
jgi:hypothetical protein